VTIHDPGTGLRVVTATRAAVASLLALIDNQLDLRVRAAEHRRTGAGYSKVRRALEVFAQRDVQDLGSVEFRHIEQMWSELSQTAPIVPSKPWRDALKRTAEPSRNVGRSDGLPFPSSAGAQRAESAE
jgi:hypothetical protein